MPKRDWTTCSRFFTILESNSQQNQMNLHDHLLSSKIFTLIINQDIHWSFRNYEENGYGYNFDFLNISH